MKVRAPRMLLVDTAYTHAMMVERGLLDLLLVRDLKGYFDHVWSVHPFASLFLPRDARERYGPPDTFPINARHTLIEGKQGRFWALRAIEPLNFLVSQLGVVRHLSRLIRKEGIDVVRAEDALYNGLLAWFLARLHNLPLVIGIWGNPGDLRARTRRPLMPRFFRSVRVEEAVERFVLRRADLALAQNEDNRRFILSRGVPIEKTAIFRLGNAIHPIHFSEPSQRPDGWPDLEALGLSRGDDIVLCISRLIPEKLVEDAVRALGALRRRGRTATLVFVGDGASRDALAALAAELGVGANVVFAGNRDQEWLSRVVPKAAAVVSPLTGRALAEAALGGAPVVAYAIDWQPEAIRTGETGELVPLGDHEAMAASLERFLLDPAYAGRMGDNVRRLMAEMMDPATLDRSQISAYEALLGRPHTAPNRLGAGSATPGRPEDPFRGRGKSSTNGRD